MFHDNYFVCSLIVICDVRFRYPAPAIAHLACYDANERLFVTHWIDAKIS
jgi:hypothetical protein